MSADFRGKLELDPGFSNLGALTKTGSDYANTDKSAKYLTKDN